MVSAPDLVIKDNPTTNKIRCVYYGESPINRTYSFALPHGGLRINRKNYASF
jgi:hypothetical protein